MTPILLGLIAHIIGDFWLQSDNIIVLKRKGQFKGYFLHWLYIFLPVFALFLFFNLKIAIFFAFSLSLLHILVDICKTFIKNKFNLDSPLSKLYLFLIDQIIHVLLIIILYETIFPADFAFATRRIDLLKNSISTNKILLYIFMYSLATLPSSFLISKILNLVNSNFKNYTKTTVTKYLGIIERILIMTLFAFDIYTIIVAIIMAKTYVRYKYYSDNNFLNYFLIGTLSSSFLAIIYGITIKYSSIIVNLFRYI